MGKRLMLVAVLLALCCVLTTAVGVAYWALSNETSIPVIMINAPRNGDQIDVGQETIVHAVARSERKIKRVELWVDGQLQDAQTSNVAGGISPFPIVANWQPATAGAHTLVVRAFDVQDARANASLTIEAVQNADRDHDDVPDALDRCPDQPGPEPSDGCPAPGANDRDGDGIADSADRCPDQVGTVLAQGCPDADGDSVADSSDACPRELGSPQNNGCPVPGDADGDSVADASDRCPSEPGDPTLGGCSDDATASVQDRDGDGVSDSQDLCPDTPGPAENNGCPPGGGDAPPPGGGDAPPPGGDTDGDDIADEDEPPESGDGVFGDMGGEEAINVVKIDALEFSVTQDYEEVYCYVTAPGVAERYGPFDLIGTRQWDITEQLGGANSRTIGVPVGSALDLRVECNGYYPDEGLFSIAPADLGSITRSYVENQWDGHVITEQSGMAADERGDAGHSFEVKFRLCLRSCESSAFPPPVLRLGDFLMRPHLMWTWSGNEDDITGYRFFINGHRHALIDASRPNRVRLALYDPPCGETYEYSVTAYRAHADGFNIRESPPSNTVAVRGGSCPRRVRIKFTEMSVAPYLPDDFSCCKGPYYGSFWATGSGEQKLDWRTGECKGFLWIYACKTGWDYMMSGSVANIFAGIRDSASSPQLSGWAMYAPSGDSVIVQLGEHDDLTIGARIMDADAYGHDDTRLNNQSTIPAGTSLPREITLRGGENWVTVQIEELVGD